MSCVAQQQGQVLGGGGGPNKVKVKSPADDDDLEDGEAEEREEGEESGSEEGEVDEERTPSPLPPPVDLDPGLEDGEVDDEGQLLQLKPKPKPRPTGISTKTTVKNGTSSDLESGEEPEEGEAEDGEELEEGEVTDDEGKGQHLPKSVCRFFGKGQCTWGNNCRYIHPGVMDKGLYTMFDSARPLPPQLTPPAAAIHNKTGLLGDAPPNFPPLLDMRPEEPIHESSWERGLRNAKEMIKQSVKRKETDLDFEDKKMNLSLAQEELDKENDYYVRKPSPPPGDKDEFGDGYDEPLDWPIPPPSLPIPQPPTPASNAKIDPDFVRERFHRLGKPARPDRERDRDRDRDRKGRDRDGLRKAPPRDISPPVLREAPPLRQEPEVRLVRESALRRSNMFPPNDYHRGRRPGGADDWSRGKKPSPDTGGSRGRRHTRKSSSVSKQSSYSSRSSRSRSSSRTSSGSRSSVSSRASSRTSRSSRASKSGRRRKPVRPGGLRRAPPRQALSPKPMRIAPPPPANEELFTRRAPFPGPNVPFERPTRFAPPLPPPNEFDSGIPPTKTLVRERDLKKAGARGLRLNSWSGSSSQSMSRSRSRSRSRSWSRSKSRSKSGSRARGVARRGPGKKTRSKFSRDKSGSRSMSRASSKRWSRTKSPSRSRSTSSSSSSSSSTSRSRRFPSRKRKVDKTANSRGSVEIIPPPIKTIKIGSPSPRPPVPQPEKKRPAPVPPSKPPPPKAQIKLTLKGNSGPLKSNPRILEKLSDGVHDGNEGNGEGGSATTPIANPESDNSKDEISIVEEDTTEKEKESRQVALRREELLKQLKAVEEAIAKKRSKLETKVKD